MRKLSLAYLALGLSLGCRAEPTELRPSAGATAHTAGAESAFGAGDEAEGVALVAMPDAWTGWTGIERAVTPLRVRVDNQSDRSIVVRYDHFKVSSPDHLYAAIAPMQMDERVMRAYSGPIDPVWSYDRYTVAPYYQNAYPAFGVYSDYPWNRSYWSPYPADWIDVELPTAEMLRRVLPEGVIAPGGHVEGVLFFEHVPDDATSLRLEASFPDARSDEVIARLEVPVVVVAE